MMNGIVNVREKLVACEDEELSDVLDEEFQVSVYFYLSELLYDGIAVLWSAEKVFEEIKRRIVLFFMELMRDESHEILA